MAPRSLLAAALGSALLVGCSAGTPDQPPPPLVGLDTAPEAATTLRPTAKGPLTGTIVLVDPGHAGVYDKERSGKLSSTNGLQVPCYTAGAQAVDGTGEHTLNFDLAKRTATALRARGATVVLTRADDASFGPCNGERAAVANKAKADAVVALHADSDGEDKRGFHIIYAAKMAGGKQVQAASKTFAERMATALKQAPVPPANYKGTPDLPIDPRENIAALNGLQRAPGVLVEVGNLNNPADWEALRQPATRDAVASAVADGVRAGLGR